MRRPTLIHVYWDTQVSGDEGWAYCAYDNMGAIDSGAIDADDLDGATEDVCRQLDVPRDRYQWEIGKADGGSARGESADFADPSTDPICDRCGDRRSAHNRYGHCDPESVAFAETGRCDEPADPWEDE